MSNNARSEQSLLHSVEDEVTVHIHVEELVCFYLYQLQQSC